VAGISLRDIGKRFPGGHAAVEDFSLEIADGELLVLVGPSGSGKSTVLRLIAGLEAPTSGRVLIGGEDVTDVGPQRRDLAMVFQNYALYPHKSVRENLAFGLRMRGTAPAAIAERVARVAASLEIASLLDRRPAQLSGGQRQRVALGRAIVREPRAFLLDEPLSNLDPLLRGGTRAELALLHRRLGATMVYVTHDQEEAMTLGSRIAVMNHGRLEQVGPPLEVFEQPATAFVARFVGAPSMNLWRDRGAAPGDRAGLEGIRPHHIAIVEPGAGAVEGRIEVIEVLGAQAVVHVAVPALGQELVRVVAPAGEPRRVGERVGLTLARDRMHVFDARGQRVGSSYSP
jgi:ABC-type sugar transport system ATPase subunit